MSRWLSVVGALVLCSTGLWIRVEAGRQPAAPVPAQAARMTAPEGFTVQEVYAPDKSGSIVVFTFDSDGQLVVSREKGPVVRLRDSNGDGTMDVEQVVTDQVTNCHGFQFDGADLLAVGEGPEGTGLYRVSDTDGDGAGDRVRLITRTTGAIGEHGPHAVVFGPDGYIYWMLGNHTALVPTAAPLSPYRGWREDQLLPIYVDPRGHATSIRAPGGFVARRDFSKGASTSDWETVAGGFRNAYDHAFNLSGELFTFDSDMEWDISLPWYRPVRTQHLVPGGEYGWRTGSGVWPADYPDSLPGITDVGRGSPVGVTFYHGDTYPEKYRDAFLLGDWSRGRILVGFQQTAGATYREEIEDFVLGTPLNVTDVEVGPDGSVYFSKGGRNTQGGLYRVVYEGTDARAASPASTPVDRALAQPQPRSAWARAAIRKARADAGSAWASGLSAVVTGADSPDRRVRALELLQVYGPAPDVALLRTLGTDSAWEVRASAAYYLGLHATDAARTALVAALKDAHPAVQRRAAEALVRTGLHEGMTAFLDPVADLLPLLGSGDRFVRYGAREALRRVNRNRWSEAALAIAMYPAAIDAQLALVQTTQAATDIPPLLTRQLELLQKDVPAAHLPGLLRVINLTMIRDEDVSYSAIYNTIGQRLLTLYPTGTPLLDREIARTLAYTAPEGAVSALVAQLTAPATHRDDQLFLVYCLRAMETGWEPEDRQAVVQWFTGAHAERWRGGASFIGYLQNLWDGFLDVLPPADREAALALLPSMVPPAVTATAKPVAPGSDTARLSEQELMEYMTLDPMAYTGDVTRGEEVYQKAMCAACHRFGALGQEAGPDLTDVARRFKRGDLLDSVLYPSRTISDQWASVSVVTRDKQSIVGVVVSETPEVLTLQPVGGAPVKVPIARIQSREMAKVSSMPEGLLNALTLREIADLFAFLEKPPVP